MQNKAIKQRILEISKKYDLSHLGSCLNAVDILVEIYSHKKPNDIIILSAGHAGLALYCVIEAFEGHNAEDLFLKHGVHPNYDIENGIYASTGSLGHGIGIAMGYAIANRLKQRKIFVYMTDGEMAEGSVYEALNIARTQAFTNIAIHINCNGFSAYRRVYSYTIAEFIGIYSQIPISLHKTVSEFPFLEGLHAHYCKLSDADYQLGLQLCKQE